MPQVIFSEVQWFVKQLWFYTLIACVLIGASFVIFWNIQKSVYSLDPQAIALGGGIPVAFLIALWSSFHLKTKVSNEGIYLSFFPIFMTNTYIPWAEVEKCYIRDYSLFKEFGGPGVRIRGRLGLGLTMKDMGYVVSGKKGLQLELKNGKKILVGTQKPEELAQILRSFSTIPFTAS